MSANQPITRNSLRSILAHTTAILLAAIVAAAAPLHAQNNGVNPQTANPNTREMNPYVVQGAGVTTYQGSPIGGGAGGSVTLPGAAATTAGPQSATAQTNISYPDPNQYVLSSGDLIRVTLFGVTDYFTTVRISKDGTVQLPLIGTVNLAGITIRQASDLIASALKNGGMFRNPEVMIGIAEPASITFISFAGEKTGTFPVQGQRSLLDVLANTGGLPNTAGHTLSIIRPGVDAPIVVNLGNTAQDLIKANIPILPRDTIFVERSGTVYMLGAFKTPGAFSIPATGLTLLQATTISGGPLYAGKYDDLRILRTTGTERTEVKVDIKRIQYGLDPDPILQAGDILFLPTTPLKRVLAAGGLGTLLSAVSILLLTVYQR